MVKHKSKLRNFLSVVKWWGAGESLWKQVRDEMNELLEQIQAVRKLGWQEFLCPLYAIL